MNLIFASPAAGAWALLGIPVVLAIHFLQTPSRPVAVSTLFLLARLSPKSAGGSRLDRLRQSLPLWLQLLAVLILAWLLAEPRRLRRDATQTVLVMLDSSLSMRAFEKPLHETLPARLRTLAAAAAHTEWILMETDPASERLYAGGRLEEMTAALMRWRSRLGMHDFQPALHAGLSLLRGRGLLLFVTDRQTVTPPGVELLALGHPIENVGLSGVRVTESGWEALAANFGTKPQRRTWHLEDADGKRLGAETAIELPPGGSEAIRGGFPGNTGKLRLVLSADEFPLDDTLPLVRPQPKHVRIRVEGVEHLGSWIDAFLRSETALDRVTDKPDLRLAACGFSTPVPVNSGSPAILMFHESAPQTAARKGLIVAERDPLMNGLSWEGLIVSGNSTIDRRPGDAVLLWMDDRPLILRRGPLLLVCFDVTQSNAPRMAAFVLLLHRFIETVRADTAAPEAANFETNQTLEVAGIDGKTPMRAPPEPAFFEAGPGNTRLTGAAHFADPRESDFRETCTVDRIEAAAKARRELLSQQDALTPLWVLLLAAVMAVNWVKTDERRQA